jgi:glucose/mannose-6-phosphate isomerase
MTIAKNTSPVLDLLEGFPQILHEEFERTRTLGRALRRDKYRTITIAADNQAFLGAKLFEAFAVQLSSIPVLVTDDLVFPNYVCRPGSLLIVTSQNKVTVDIIEELDALQQKGTEVFCFVPQVAKSKVCAHARPSKICTVLPEYLFFMFVFLLGGMGILKFEQWELEETVQILGTLKDQYNRNTPLALNPAKDMASSFNNKVLFLYGTGVMMQEMARVWALRIRNFTRQLADWQSLTEEGEVTSFAGNVPSDIRRGVIVLRSGSEPHYVDKRVQTLRRMCENNAIEIREVYGQGLSNLARVASLLYLGSFVSIYLALCNEFS